MSFAERIIFNVNLLPRKPVEISFNLASLVTNQITLRLLTWIRTNSNVAWEHVKMMHPLSLLSFCIVIKTLVFDRSLPSSLHLHHSLEEKLGRAQDFERDFASHPTQERNSEQKSRA